MHKCKQHGELVANVGETENSITFEAVIPSNMSALRIHGESGMRVTLDVDETNLPEALKLVLWRNRILTVTVRPGDNG